MHGIICIETEWQITTKNSRRDFNSELIVRYMGEVLKVPVIYRRVATRGELQYYLKQFGKSEFTKKYDILYFNSHGNTHGLHLEGEKELVKLPELAEMSPKAFESRLVHFSSCRTLLGSESVVRDFIEKTGARIVTGYTKSVDGYMSSIFDLALFGEYITRKQLTTMFKSLEINYGRIEKVLGFKYFM